MLELDEIHSHDGISSLSEFGCQYALPGFKKPAFSSWLKNVSNQETYCPLEHNARIIRAATPRFAQQLTHKYANMNAPAVCADLEDNHHRKIAHSYLQDVADHVVAVASA